MAATAPTGAATGNVRVVVDGLASNTVLCTVIPVPARRDFPTPWAGPRSMTTKASLDAIL